MTITRRQFIERAALSTAMLSAVRPLSAAGGMYVSLNGTLTNRPNQPLPWQDFVRLAGKLGYGGVDVNLAPARKDGVEATRALFAEAKVKPSIANLPVQFASPDDAVFQEGLKTLDEQAKFAAAIGLERMMAVLSPGSPVPKEERHAFIKQRLAPIAEILSRSNIRLGLEFLGVLQFRTGARAPHQYIWTLPDTVALAKEIGPNIGVVLDVWHWHHSGGTIADIAATDPSRIVHVHVSDAKPMPPETVRDDMRLMPGEGSIDLIGFFQALKQVGYTDGVSPEPLGRIPAAMQAEEAARLGLETTLAVMRKAGVA